MNRCLPVSYLLITTTSSWRRVRACCACCYIFDALWCALGDQAGCVFIAAEGCWSFNNLLFA